MSSTAAFSRQLPSEKREQQIIKDRYLDGTKLENMLARKFRPGSFSITVKCDPFFLVIPIENPKGAWGLTLDFWPLVQKQSMDPWGARKADKGIHFLSPLQQLYLGAEFGRLAANDEQSELEIVTVWQSRVLPVGQQRPILLPEGSLLLRCIRVGDLGQAIVFPVRK